MTNETATKIKTKCRTSLKCAINPSEENGYLVDEIAIAYLNSCQMDAIKTTGQNNIITVGLIREAV